MTETNRLLLIRILEVIKSESAEMYRCNLMLEELECLLAS